jgi:hypothetical protein
MTPFPKLRTRFPPCRKRETYSRFWVGINVIWSFLEVLAFLEGLEGVEGLANFAGDSAVFRHANELKALKVVEVLQRLAGVEAPKAKQMHPLAAAARGASSEKDMGRSRMLRVLSALQKTRGILQETQENRPARVECLAIEVKLLMVLKALRISLGILLLLVQECL